MRSLLLALTLLLAPTPQAAPASDLASVEGFVVKLGTSDPVARARVLLNKEGDPAHSMTATTDGGGKFVFEGVVPGRYRISATRDGYVPAEYGQRDPKLPGNAITAAPKQELKDLRVDLTPTAAISGRIYDRFGDPVGNADVQAMKYAYQDGRRILSVVQSVRTNDLGEYRLFWMEPGRYIVSAVPVEAQLEGLTSQLAAAIKNINVSAGGIVRGVVNPPPDSTETYLPVYYPGTTEVASAAPIDIGPGANFSGVDLTVVDIHAVNIRGRVVSGSGGPPSGASVMLIPRGTVVGAQNRNASVTAEGAFEFRGIAQGEYDLVGRQQSFSVVITGAANATPAARPPGSSPGGGVGFSSGSIPPLSGLFVGRISLDVGSADIDGISISLQPGFNLRGRIATDNRGAAAGDSAATNMRVQLRPDPYIPQLSPPTASVDGNGAFTITGIAPGDYRLSVNGMPHGSYVMSANLAGADASNLMLRLDGEPQGQLVIAIGTNPGSLDASVQDDKQQPVAGATVVLIPDVLYRQRSELYRTATSDSAGRIHLDGVAPGDYKLFAWESVENGAWQDPDFIRVYEDSGRAVHIGEGTRESSEVRVIP